MSEGQAFMFSPGGMIPIAPDGTPLQFSGVDSTAMAASVVPQQERTTPEPVRTTQPTTPQPAVVASEMKTPKDVIRAAKARIKELRSELRDKKKLERELKELERLVAASKRPVAIVRALDTSRQAR